MAKRKGIGEIIIEAANRRIVKEKAWVLQKHKNDPQLITMLKYIYKDSIQWALPKGNMPFDPDTKRPLVRLLDKASDAQNVLRNNMKKLPKLYMVGGMPNLKQPRREQLFLELLESVDPDDAKVLMFMINKEIPKLSKKAVMEAFPEHTQGW